MLHCCLTPARRFTGCWPHTQWFELGIQSLTLDHSKMKYSNFIGYLQVSISCRSLIYVSIDPCL